MNTASFRQSNMRTTIRGTSNLERADIMCYCLVMNVLLEHLSGKSKIESFDLIERWGYNDLLCPISKCGT